MQYQCVLITRSAGALTLYLGKCHWTEIFMFSGCSPKTEFIWPWFFKVANNRKCTKRPLNDLEHFTNKIPWIHKVFILMHIFFINFALWPALFKMQYVVKNHKCTKLAWTLLTLSRVPCTRYTLNTYSPRTIFVCYALQAVSKIQGSCNPKCTEWPWTL